MKPVTIIVTYTGYVPEDTTPEALRKLEESAEKSIEDDLKYIVVDDEDFELDKVRIATSYSLAIGHLE